MPRPGPRRQFVGARMSDEQIAALDRIAAWGGVERSEVIRRAVDAWVAARDTTDPSATMHETTTEG